MRIRRAREEDIPSIELLWKGLITCHRERFGYGDELFRYKQAADAMWRAWTKGKLRARDSRLFVAEEDGMVIGYINASIIKLPPIYVHDREVHINGIFVADGWRGKGVGTALMREVEAWARRRGIYSIGLMVNISNRDSYSAYEAMGFSAHHTKMSRKVQL